MSSEKESVPNSNTLNPTGEREAFPVPSGRRRSSYFTFYTKSLRHYLTSEQLPREESYRDIRSIVGGKARPSLHELHNETFNQRTDQVVEKEEEKKKTHGKVVKLGWKKGVLMNCLLNIWGVMTFLRLSWVVGECGIIFGMLVTLLANSITSITAISMSAVATNGQIEAGGVYYMISRSLGPEFGGSIGLLFTVAISISGSTHVLGFVNSLQDMMREYFGYEELIPGLGGGLTDARILGTITLILVLGLAIVGMDWVARVQMGLVVLLLASQVNFIVGACLGPQDDEERAKGFVGLNGEVFNENLKTDFRYFEGEHNFFTVFGVFFPGVTGIVAGANISGDLKDPGDAIPKGTLLAIFITTIAYAIYPFFMGGGVVRDASGNVTMYREYSNLSSSIYDNPCFNRTFCPDEHCDYGSQNYFQVMELMSSWGPLIYMGSYAATLSSAIACVVGAPRVLQALAKDKIYPYIHFFAAGWGANNDPVRGYGLVFFITFACVMVGELNAVSSLLTNCFLASYSMINFSCFHASLIKSPGWRPAFKYYSMYGSFIGGVLCLAVMFLIDWKTALITFAVAIFLYMYVKYLDPDVNWGSSVEGQSYLFALKSTFDLSKVHENVKNYRPQIIVLSGNPCFRPALVHFAHNITHNVSFLACANIVEGPLNQKKRAAMVERTNIWLQKHKVKAFYTLAEAKSLDEGAKNLYQFSGLGHLRPNLVLLGFKSDWRECDAKSLTDYFNTIHASFNFYLAVSILRVQNGFDYSYILEDESLPVVNEKDEKLNTNISIKITPPSDGNTPTDIDDIEGGTKIPNGHKEEKEKDDEEDSEEEETTEEKLNKRNTLDNLYRGVNGTKIPQTIIKDLNRFTTKQPKGTIDVWWLYDDGGLTLLLPHILATRHQWSKCKLRVFALANRRNELDVEHRSMISLLAKFRIDVKDVVIISDLGKIATQKSRDEFQDMISKFRRRDSEPEKEGLWIGEEELELLKEKTNRHLRLRELLMENSQNASLIVMTLPLPRQNRVSAPLYMAWLETITKDLPPFLLIRGNQQSVLTFYS